MGRECPRQARYAGAVDRFRHCGLLHRREDTAPTGGDLTSKPQGRQSRTLASLGDTLASELISDDLWVKDVECFIRKTL